MIKIDFWSYRCRDYYAKIVSMMSHEMVHEMRKIEMTEEEYSVMLAIAAFRTGEGALIRD